MAGLEGEQKEYDHRLVVSLEASGRDAHDEG
jgi:hypothetical protein